MKMTMTDGSIINVRPTYKSSSGTPAKLEKFESALTPEAQARMFAELNPYWDEEVQEWFTDKPSIVNSKLLTYSDIRTLYTLGIRQVMLTPEAQKNLIASMHTPIYTTADTKLPEGVAGRLCGIEFLEYVDPIEEQKRVDEAIAELAKLQRVEEKYRAVIEGRRWTFAEETEWQQQWMSGPLTKVAP